MTDQPALPPSDDDVDDDLELDASWVKQDGLLFRLIREVGEGDAWIASTRWADDEAAEAPDESEE